jgi:hypothetical protein
VSAVYRVSYIQWTDLTGNIVTGTWQSVLPTCSLDLNRSDFDGQDAWIFDKLAVFDG